MQNNFGNLSTLWVFLLKLVRGHQNIRIESEPLPDPKWDQHLWKSPYLEPGQLLLFKIRKFRVSPLPEMDFYLWRRTLPQNVGMLLGSVTLYCVHQ